MSSSTSSSEPARVWWRFFRLARASRRGSRRSSTLSSPPSIRSTPCRSRLRFARAPISTNARFSFPAARALAEIRQRRVRLLDQPLAAAGDAGSGFGARFVNLAMNAATAYEQSRILRRVLRASPRCTAVIIGSTSVVRDGDARYTPRPFPNGCTARSLARLSGTLQYLRADRSGSPVRARHGAEAVALWPRRLHQLRAR